MVDVALMIAIAARKRTESRGAHARRDFPGSDNRWNRHWTPPPLEAKV
jgi:succinate dehydrogenase/fumarate reductase flavoprotein subunit